MRLNALALDELSTAEARTVLSSALEMPDAAEQVYGALSRWTWRVLIERRLDDGLREWHRLLLDCAAKLRLSEPTNPGGRDGISARAASQRIRAFADLVRESIRASEAALPTQFTKRAHVLEVLRELAAEPEAHVERVDLRTRIGLNDANLSRVLTLLAANGLVERQARGKAAAFRITRKALAVLASRESTRSEQPTPMAEIVMVELTPKRRSMPSDAVASRRMVFRDAPEPRAMSNFPTFRMKPTDHDIEISLKSRSTTYRSERGRAVLTAEIG